MKECNAVRYVNGIKFNITSYNILFVHGFFDIRGNIAYATLPIEALDGH